MKSEFSTPKDIKILPSDYSHTSFKIKIQNIPSIKTQKIVKEQRRSQAGLYGQIKKRQPSKNGETMKFQSKSRKKVNTSIPLHTAQKQNPQMNLKGLINILMEQQDDYFNLQNQVSAQKNDYYKSNKAIIFPDSQLPELKQSRNELLTRNIEIMSNQNQKISIPIHQGLYKSNTSHKNDNFQQGYVQIPNLCDFRMKNQYSESIKFIRDYKSGYIPIEMQKRNNEEVQQDKKDQQETTQKNNKDKSRSHFIRKQQSTLSLPRTCGVSYIKPSESLLTQKLPFEPLPPLIFQGSTSCSIGSNEETILVLNSEKKDMINKFNFSLQNSWLPFVASNQDQMRDLLLGKKTKSAKVGFVHGVQNLWPLFAEGSFILIIISPSKLTNQSEVWQAFQNKLTYFKIGILSKKSTSGKKAFLKSIKAQGSDNLSVASFDTYHNQIKDQNNNLKVQVQKSLPHYESRISIDLKDSPQEEKKVSTTFDILEEQLKDSRTVITMSLRLEMYVQENDWKEKLNRENKEVLNQIILNLKERLEKKSIKIICERLLLAKEDKKKYFDQKLNFLRIENNQKSKAQGSISKKKINKQEKSNITEISLLLENQNAWFLQSSSQLHKRLIQNTIECSPGHFLNSICTQQSWKKSLNFPLYYISTRDSFAFDLIEKKTILKRSNGREYTKIEYYFYPDNVPTNFGSQYRKLFPKLDVGVTAYHGFYTEEQLRQFEENTFDMQKNAFRNKFAQMTVQPSIVSTKIKRTKFFFGYRYMWTRCQLSEPCSYVGAGVRKDVASPPQWTKQISDQMVKENIVEKDFINSIAINVYHDGKQGLAQHFDDAVRFKQPIYTLRLFSDARLSFGSQFYGFCNGAFIIPLPRGCILVMEQNSYAANGVKHCVRPCDMTGKSAAVILRQMHSQVVTQASKYDENIDFPAWLSCLSEDENSITFAQQKRLEAEQIMKTKIE